MLAKCLSVEFFAISSHAGGRDSKDGPHPPSVGVLAFPLARSMLPYMYRFIPSAVSVSLYPRRNTAIGDFVEAPASRYVYTQIAETRRNLCGRERSLPRRHTGNGSRNPGARARTAVCSIRKICAARSVYLGPPISPQSARNI